MEALACIIEVKAHNFIWKFIIYHFGPLRAIIMDNGCQFDNTKFVSSAKTWG